MLPLRFARSLYSRDALERAAAAYTPLLHARVEEQLDEFVVNVEGQPAEDVLDAFANHVLFETIRLRQRAAESRA